MQLSRFVVASTRIPLKEWLTPSVSTSVSVNEQLTASKNCSFRTTGPLPTVMLLMAKHLVPQHGIKSVCWHDGLIKSGFQLREYAIEYRLNRTHIPNLLPLTLLSPNILRNALAASKQLDWDRQAAELGINTALSQFNTAQSAS